MPDRSKSVLHYPAEREKGSGAFIAPDPDLFVAVLRRRQRADAAEQKPAREPRRPARAA